MGENEGKAFYRQASTAVRCTLRGLVSRCRRLVEVFLYFLTCKVYGSGPIVCDFRVQELRSLNSGFSSGKTHCLEPGGHGCGLLCWKAPGLVKISAVETPRDVGVC